MILSGLKIKKELDNNNITISPYNGDLMNPNSYNYRLAETLYEITDYEIDASKKSNVKEIIIPEDGYVLEPNKLYLGSTFEKIGSKKYVTQLIGRSSVGRLGLFLQVTAPLGHVGCELNWTLELRCVQPVRIYKNMKIGQVTFWKIKGGRKLNYSSGKYNNYSLAEVSKLYEEVIK